MTDSAELRGILPMLVTPFAENGAIDHDAVRALVRLQVTAGADAVAMLGLGGEGYALSTDERDAVVATVAAELAGACPLIVGVSGGAAEPAIELGRRAVDRGATGLLALPPSLVKPGPEQLLDFYGSLGAATQVPIMVQDAPESGLALSLDFYRALAAIPYVTAVKIETPPTATKIAAVHDAVGDALTIVGGRAGLALPDELAAGAVATMPFCDSPERFRRIVDLWAAADYDASVAAFAELVPVLNLMATVTTASQAVCKYLLCRRGVLTNWAVRSPTPELADLTRIGLDRLLAVLAAPSR